jgi:hypothetical protein
MNKEYLFNSSLIKKKSFSTPIARVRAFSRNQVNY